MSYVSYVKHSLVRYSFCEIFITCWYRLLESGFTRILCLSGATGIAYGYHISLHSDGNVLTLITTTALTLVNQRLSKGQVPDGCITKGGFFVTISLPGKWILLAVTKSTAYQNQSFAGQIQKPPIVKPLSKNLALPFISLWVRYCRGIFVQAVSPAVGRFCL